MNIMRRRMLAIFLLQFAYQFDIGLGGEADRESLMRWANGSEILTEGTIFDEVIRNVLPLELFSKEIDIEAFSKKFGIKKSDLVYTGGVNGALHFVYRLSETRLLVCFTTLTMKDRKTGIDMVRFASVIPDPTGGAGTSFKGWSLVARDLYSVNSKNYLDMSALLRAEMKRRASLANDKGSSIPRQRLSDETEKPTRQ